MPHSLRARLSGLRYKGIITDKDYQRLCNALDIEKVLDDIKAEINERLWEDDAERVCEIIDKHISGKDGE